MKINRSVFVYFCLTTAFSLLAADQGRDLVDILDEYAQGPADLARVQGLVEAQCMVQAVRSQKMLNSQLDYQYMSQTHCLYEAFCSFEKNLSKVAGRIQDKELRIQLYDLETELRKQRLAKDPYVDQWPQNVPTCKVNWEGYQNRLIPASEKIKQIASDFEERLASGKNRLNEFVEKSVGVRQFRDVFTEQIRELGRQRNIVEKELEILRAEKDEFEDLKERINSADQRLRRLKELQASHEQEATKQQEDLKMLSKEMEGKKAAMRADLDEIIRSAASKKAELSASTDLELRQNQERVASQKQAVQADYSSWLSAREKDKAAQADRINGDIKNLEKQLAQRKEQTDKALASLAAALSQKEEEVEKFKKAYGELIEASFPSLAKNRIAFSGFSERDPIQLKIVRTLTRLVTDLENQFARSHVARGLGPEKIVQHRYTYNVVGVREKGNLFGQDGLEISLYVVAEVVYLNIIESIHSETWSLEFDAEGALKAGKNLSFPESMKSLIFKQIPESKRSVFEGALSRENQRMLYGYGEAALQKSPVSSLMHAGGAYLQPPAYPYIAPSAPEFQTGEGEGEEGQP